jgi:hypothetical protein
VTRWEYKFLRFETFRLIEAQLNYYGNEGWEAVSFAFEPDGPVITENDQGHVRIDGMQGVKQVWIALLKRPHH